MDGIDNYKYLNNWRWLVWGRLMIKNCSRCQLLVKEGIQVQEYIIIVSGTHQQQEITSRQFESHH